MLYAHSENPAGQGHELLDHLRSVADSARRFADAWAAGDVAAWLGWWHDAGKASDEFQQYLTNEPKPPHGPDHSSVGAVEVANSFSPLAMIVAGHHGGLINLEDLKARLQRKVKDPWIRDVLGKASPLIPCDPPMRDLSQLHPLFDSEPDRRRAAMFLRMVHSAVVDADCLNTEQHFEPRTATLRQGYASVEELWPLIEADQRHLMDSAADTPVNQTRREVYEACLTAAELSPGFFNLTVPTGGGKTRSGVAFALKHALRYDLRRVIVALPYTTIIEQNADEYRSIFGDRVVLEHHSSVAPGEETGEASEAERRARLAAENWDAPIVVTTTVQFFESLFASRNSRLRKLHNIARSVIILDEVQTLPIGLLAPTLEALGFLVKDFGCTVVLCTATQPALNRRADLPQGIEGSREIVLDYETHFRTLARVDYSLPPVDAEPWSWERLAEEIARHDRALVVMNTIGDALTLLERLPSEDLLHLSTNLCGAHRRKVLAEVRRRLAEGEPCRVVSTQVVEAGVDLDFPVVFRAMGPLDRIAQAAGRCNREGRLDSGHVVVFRLAEGKMPPGSYRAGADTAEGMLRAEADINLHDPEVFRRYFQRLYQAQNVDSHAILDKLHRWHFADVAAEYRLIEDDTVAVVVRYGPDKDRVDALLDSARMIGRLTREIARKLQPYLVSLRRRVFAELQSAGLLTQPVDDLWVWEGGYDEVRGFMREGFRTSDLVI